MNIKKIHSPTDLAERITQFGVLPLFGCRIPGLSAAEMTPGGLWFSDDGDGGHGLWSWKMPVIQSRCCAYGQFFGGKKGFVSAQCLPDFINWRRHSQVTTNEDKAALEDIVWEVLAANGAMTKAEIRKAMGDGMKQKSAADMVDTMADRKLPLDAVLSGLQKSCRVIISDITPRLNRSGEEDRYGWQVAHFDIPENVFGAAALKSNRAPKESHKRLVDKILESFPEADVPALMKLV